MQGSEYIGEGDKTPFHLSISHLKYLFCSFFKKNISVDP
jgi:hypothetical protein